MNKQTKRLIALIINLFVIITEIYALTLTLLERGYHIFEFYTDNSNLFTLIVAIWFSCFLLKALENPTITLPKTLRILKLFSASVMAITFVVVVFILIPLSGGVATSFILFHGSMLYHHFFCPIFVLVSFLFFEDDILLSFKDSFLSLIPTLVYAGIIVTLNIVKRIIGPYPFLHIYEQSLIVTIIWCFAIFSIAYIIGFLLYAIKNKVTKKSYLIKKL